MTDAGAEPPNRLLPTGAPMTIASLQLEPAAVAEASAGFRDAFAQFVQRLDILNHPDELLDMLAGMNAVIAAVLLTVGVICVVNGYRWHRWIIVVCAFLAGIGLGVLLSDRVGETYVIAGALGILCAVIATPLLRFTVAIFGGLTGAFIGANLWTALGQDPTFHWAGAAMGFIAVALTSFLAFKHVIVVFTSIAGATLVVFSAITLLLNIPSFQGAVEDSIGSNPLLAPLLVLVAATIGLVLQEGKPEEKPAEE